MSDRIVTWDAETFYDPPSGYSLSSMSTADYIRDDRFKLLGFGLQVGAGEAKYFHGDALLRNPTFRAKLEDSIILAHNAAFDCAILNLRYGIRPKGILDTLSMARGLGLQATVGGSLAKLCKHFDLGEKAELRPDSTPEELALRGSIDAALTYKLLLKLLPGFPPKELKLIDMTIRQFTEPSVLADVPLLNELSDRLAREKEEALAALGVDQITLSSTTLFASLLEDMGVEVPLKPGGNGINMIPACAKTDQGMKDLLEHDDPRVQALAAARLQVKSTGDETRARRYVDMARHGPLPVWYNYWGAHPGRFTGGDKTNFANLKRGSPLRDALLAPQGHIFVAGDLKQIQARLTAMLAGCDSLLDGFANNDDVYATTASYAFRKPVTAEDNPMERFVGKFTVLGCNFGMGAEKFRVQFKADLLKNRKDFPPLNLEQSRGVVDAYRVQYPEIPELWKRAENLLGKPGTELGPVVSEGDAILLPNGMRLRYPGLRYESYEIQGERKTGWRYDGKKGRVGIWGGTVVQNIVTGLERCLLGEAMLRLLPFWKIPLHTYDELVIMAREDQKDSAWAALEFALTRVPTWMPELPIAVDMGADRRYGKC